MIDFHSHILPNIDDGSTSIEESIAILKEAKEAGFTKIISTSHYMNEYYECDEQKRIELLNQLKNHCYDIELYLGNEIYITDKIIELIKERKVSTINNSRYILIEFPMNYKAIDAENIIFKLLSNNYIPIIAHPERYKYVQEDIGYIEKLLDMGVLFQANYASIIGLYGSKAQKAVKKLLKNNMIHFLGSDVHSINQIYPKMPKIMKKLRKITTDEKLSQLTTVNAQKVLNNEEINAD